MSVSCNTDIVQLPTSQIRQQRLYEWLNMLNFLYFRLNISWHQVNLFFAKSILKNKCQLNALTKQSARFYNLENATNEINKRRYIRVYELILFSWYQFACVCIVKELFDRSIQHCQREVQYTFCCTGDSIKWCSYIFNLNYKNVLRICVTANNFSVKWLQLTLEKFPVY